MHPVTLLQLPREIRDRIYDFVFVKKEIHAAHLGENTLIRPLRLVNRQISAEAAVRFYGNRVWVGQSPELLHFLEKIGSCRNLIKVVKVDYFSMESCKACSHQFFDLLSCLSSLRMVKLMMIVHNLEAAQKPPAVMELDLLKDQVEVAIHNDYFHVDVSSDIARALSIRGIIWRRAAGAKSWLQDEEEVVARPVWY